MSRVLVVDDEASICWALREFLGDQGHEVDVASSAEEGLELAGREPHDAVILDVRLPGIDGLSALGKFRELAGPAPIIVITAFGNLETAVRAMEGGAFDYLVKPFDLDQAATVVARALDAGRGRQDAEGRRTPTAPSNREVDQSVLIGHSPPMQELFKQIALVAPTDVPVLITGESGTGKELVARAIHRHSTRRDRTFLPVCLAALSSGLIERELFGHLRGSFTGAVQDRKGLLELADGGTVLLDEIGDVPPAVQVKLLAGHRAPRDHSGRRCSPPADQRSLSGRDQSPAGRADGRRRVPRRSVLSPQRLSDPGASPARPSRRHPALRQPLPGPPELASRRTGGAARRRGERPDVSSLAGQRPRAAQRHRARGDRRTRPGNPPRAPTPAGRSATQAGFLRHLSR